MRTLRTCLALAAVVAVVTVTASAGPPVTTFPARFANHERLTAVGIVSGHGIWRRHVERGTNDDVLVFDDATNLHFEEPGSSAEPARATWRCPARRTVLFTFTPETVTALKDAIQSGVPFPVDVKVGTGRLTFGRKLLAYSGTQVVRCSGRYAGYSFSVVETMRYSGTLAPGPAATAVDSETLQAAIGGAVGRLASRFRWPEPSQR